MNEFVNRFKEKVDIFYDTTKDEQNNILKDILNYANSNPQKFKREFDEMKFNEEFDPSAIISEALSKDTETWGQFYIDFLEDIFEKADHSHKPNDILYHLTDFAYIEEDERPFVQKIVDRLYKEIDSKNLHIKIAVIWILPNFFGNTSIKNESMIVDKLQQQLYHENWKVRVVAYKSLGFENLIPDGYKLSFKDKMTKLIFGEPKMI